MARVGKRAHLPLPKVVITLNCIVLQDKMLRQNEATSLRKQIEAEYQKKVKLEDDILEKLRSQLTIDKAAQYTDKIIGKIKKRSRDLVS